MRTWIILIVCYIFEKDVYSPFLHVCIFSCHLSPWIEITPFLQNGWVSLGGGRDWNLRVIASLSAVERSVTKSPFALQWWLPSLIFTRNRKANESASRTLQEWHAMLRLTSISYVTKEISKKKKKVFRSPSSRNTGTHLASFFLNFICISRAHLTFLKHQSMIFSLIKIAVIE